MAKIPAKSRKEWTAEEVKILRQLVKENTPTRVIGLKMERTPAAIYSKAQAEEISLKPTNQSPNKKKKT